MRLWLELLAELEQVFGQALAAALEVELIGAGQRAESENKTHLQHFTRPPQLVAQEPVAMEREMHHWEKEDDRQQGRDLVPG